MRYTPLVTRFAALMIGVAALAACADGPDPAGLTPDDPAFASSGPVLVECPVDYELSTTGTLDALGGAIRLENHEMALPMLAVTIPTEFRLAAPVSNYMEIGINPSGGSGFQFNKLVAITIDYSRCSRSNIDKAPLSVWQIDPETKELLEYMGGQDDKDARTIRFYTDHLSHFSIAQ